MNTIYKSASLGGQQILPCGVVFPTQQKDMGFVVTWKKGSLGLDHVLLTKVDGYSPTIEKDYQERLHIVNKASLQISHIEARDQDWYECSILFTNGNRETPMNNTWIYLTVHSPPHITRSSGTLLNVPKGEKTRLFCEGKGSPEPKITWTKDGQVLNNTARTIVDKNEVRINNVQREDGGIYTCTFSNIVGDRSQPIKLVVEGGPYIMTHPGNQTVLEGQRVVFPCGTEGYPSTIVHTWYRDLMDLRMTDGYRAGRILLMPDGSLVIKTTVKTDKGWYTCRPSNGLGQDEASAYLNVVYKPVVLAMPSQLAWAKGFRQRIDCLVDSNPPLQNVYWVKDQEQLSSAGRIEVLSNGTLFVNDVEEADAGSYRCTPENAMGQGLSSNRVQVSVRDPPQIMVSPQVLYVRHLGDNVLMSCEASGVPTPLIQWIKVGGHHLSNNRRVTVTDRYLEIKNITKEDHGKYECRAVNSIAAAFATTELRIDSTTPHAPYNVTVTPGLFNVTVSWEPAYDGGVPQVYAVWFKKSTQSDWVVMPVPGQEVTYFTLHKLQPDTEYEFKVVAVNSLGNGSFSNVVKQKTLEYSPDAVSVLPSDQNGEPYYPEIHENLGVQPSAPLNVTAYVRGKDIFLKWRPPTNSPVPIFSYRIEYQHDGKWQVYDHRIVGNLSNSVVLPNMPSGTYHIWIRSRGVLAYSATSNTVRVRVSNDGVLIPQALIGGIIGGVLFLLVAILLALVAVFYSRRKERKAKEKHYNGVIYGKPHEMNGRYPEFETKRYPRKHYGGGDFVTSPGSAESIFVLPQPHPHNQSIRAMRPLMLLQKEYDREGVHGGGKGSGHTTGQQVPWTNQSSSLGRNRQPGSFRQKLNKANLKIGNMTWPDEHSDDRSRDQFLLRSLPTSYNHLPKIHPPSHDDPRMPKPQRHPPIVQSHSSLSKSYSFPSCHDKNTRLISSVDLQPQNLHPANIPPSASYPSYFEPTLQGCSSANPSSVQSNHNSIAVMTSQPHSQPCLGCNKHVQVVFRNSPKLPNPHEARLAQLSGPCEVPLPQLSGPRTARLPQKSSSHQIPLYQQSNLHDISLHQQSNLHDISLHQQSNLHDISLYQQSNLREVPRSQPGNPHETPCFQLSRHMKPNRPAHGTNNTPNYHSHSDRSAGRSQLNISKNADGFLNRPSSERIRNITSCHGSTKGSSRFVSDATFSQINDGSSKDFDGCYDSCYSNKIQQTAAQRHSQGSRVTCQRSLSTLPQKTRNVSFSRAVSQSGSKLQEKSDHTTGYYDNSHRGRHSDDTVQPRKHSQIPEGHSSMQSQKQMSSSARHSSLQSHKHLLNSNSRSTLQAQKYVPISESHSTQQLLEKLPITQSHSSQIPYYKKSAHAESNNSKQCIKYLNSRERNDKPVDSSYHGGGHYSASHKLPFSCCPPVSGQLPVCSVSYPDLSLPPAGRASSEAGPGYPQFPHKQKHYPRSKSHEANMDVYGHKNYHKLQQQHSHPRCKVAFYSGNSTAALSQKRSLKPFPSENHSVESRMRDDASQQRHSEASQQRHSEASQQRHSEASQQRHSEASQQRHSEASQQRHLEASQERYSEVSQQRLSDTVCHPSRNDTAAAGLDSNDAVRIVRSGGADSQGNAQLEGERTKDGTSFSSVHDGPLMEYNSGIYNNRQLCYQKSGDRHFQKDDLTDYLRISCQTSYPGRKRECQGKSPAKISPSQLHWHPEFEKRLQRLREEFQQYIQNKQSSYTGQSALMTTNFAFPKGENKSSMHSMDSEML